MENDDNNVIGRFSEVKKFQTFLKSTEPEFLSVYGRRRVGKTYLIRQFFKDQIVFDFTGTKEASLEVQLDNFYEEFQKRAHGKYVRQAPKSWQEAFANLATYLYSLKSKKDKIVVFIDEMPWLDTPRANFIPSLEFFWNQHLSQMNHVILIACGSATSWIRKNLNNARGGLYNRVTQRMRLAPFTLAETEDYLRSKRINLPRKHIIELYMAFGGIPFYLKYIESGKSVLQIINNICFLKDAPLQDEYKQLYFSLFRNAEKHEKVIEILASRPQGLTRKDLLDLTKLPNGTLSRTLMELEECDFISMYSPFGKKKKEGVYKLIDNFSLFYLKFMQGQKVLNGQIWQTMSNDAAYKAWSGYAFENICLLHLPQILTAMGISGIRVNAFSWKTPPSDQTSGVQIDLLIDRTDNVINLCEVKFTGDTYIMTKDYADQLRQRRSIFKLVSKTKKAVFNTLITPYEALKNEHYLDQIHNEVNMDAMFKPL